LRGIRKREGQHQPSHRRERSNARGGDRKICVRPKKTLFRDAESRGGEPCGGHQTIEGMTLGLEKTHPRCEWGGVGEVLLTREGAPGRGVSRRKGVCCHPPNLPGKRKPFHRTTKKGGRKKESSARGEFQTGGGEGAGPRTVPGPVQGGVSRCPFWKEVSIN